jgi:8-oxo-dGTP pyrophosphatase MutT (NUDIX family)
MFRKELYRQPLPVQPGRMFERKAVRAVIYSHQKLLMVYSANVGDYKFPGGGIHPGESHLEALKRETQEEAGAILTQMENLLGLVDEFDLATEPGYEYFKMTSFYYQVSIQRQLTGQHLDDYEKELGFTPVWISIAEAIQANQEVMKNPNLKMPFWTQRELDVLRELKSLHMD